jgi:dipeptidyl-peptidase-3
MKYRYPALITGILAITMSQSCKNHSHPEDTGAKKENTFEYVTEQFADLQILRYQVPGFDELSTKEKELLYYLYEAALCGRDIIFDQKYKHNLAIRHTLDNIVQTYGGDKSSAEWGKFMIYVKRVWFSNGIHHHYSNSKFLPEIEKDYFLSLMEQSAVASFPFAPGSPEMSRLVEIIFNPDIDGKIVNQAAGIDNVAMSANNFYENITQKEVEDYYAQFTAGKGTKIPEYGLNSKLMKVDGKIVEKTWKVGGMYSPAIEKIVYWLEKAIAVAENKEQADALQKLVSYYKSGSVDDWDTYNIAWVKDTKSNVDVVNGFVEVYLDAIGKKGSFESVVSFRDVEATKRIKAIGDQAQWFEDHAPISTEHKKENVTGIEAKVITVVVESGDAAPSTPIGINLPNNNWVRQEHGSKSVSLGNIVHTYNEAKSKGSALDEFGLDTQVIGRMKKYASLAADLHTDMHEVIGHASGKINPGIGTPDQTLKQYASTLEEARADLVALYFIMDPKLIEIGVMNSLEVGRAEYDSYIMNGLITQLTRLKLGDEVEEAHMRNRQLVAKWALEKGSAENVIEWVKKEGKTYVRINDYDKLRSLFGELLKEIQRIKSEGDFAAGQALVEKYGVKVDQKLHKEVLERYARLNLAPYSGFIQPKLVPVIKNDKIVDVKIEYPEDFTQQMLEYGKNYSFLPLYN